VCDCFGVTVKIPGRLGVDPPGVGWCQYDFCDFLNDIFILLFDENLDQHSIGIFQQYNPIHHLRPD
jgi:hypothetical protein